MNAGQLDLFAAAPPPAPPVAASPAMFAATKPEPCDDWPDFASLYGNEIAKRALEIAAVARHTILLIGPEPVADQLIEAACGLAMMSAAHGEIADQSDFTELFVEVSEPRECDRFPQEDTTARIRARVQIAAKRREGINPASLEEPAKKLLTDASVGMDLDRERVKKVLSVARSIAALAGCDRIGRIHIAEALSYSCPIEARPEPKPEPSIDPEQVEGSVEYCQALRVRGREIVEIDPARVASRFEEGSKEGDVPASYSGDTLAGCNSKGSTIRKPFQFRGAEWVNTGGWGYRGERTFECYRVVAPEAFDRSTAPYREHNFHHDTERRERFGGYDGMLAKHGSRDIVLAGPPIIIIGGQPEQAALL